MTPLLLNRSVLVLNRHWLAIHICNVKRALCLLYAGLAHVVDDAFQTHDFDSWRDRCLGEDEALDLIRTPSFHVLVPQVIVLTRYARRPPQHVRFSRRNLFLRDGHQCQYCGQTPPRDRLTLDHILPRSRGGKTTWENVVVSCVRCNTRKGNHLPEEVGMRLRDAPQQPDWPLLAQRAGGAKPLTMWQKFVKGTQWAAVLSEA